MPQSPPFNPQDLPLRDIHLPPAIGYWPPAPGWWGLLLLSILCLLLGYWFRRRMQRRRWRKLALRQLERLNELPDAEFPTAVSRLLRQAALCHFPRQSCAGLCGEPWLEFLDRPFSDQPFSAGAGRCLNEAPYRPTFEYDRTALSNLCRRWLQKLPLAPLKKGAEQ